MTQFKLFLLTLAVYIGSLGTSISYPVYNNPGGLIAQFYNQEMQLEAQGQGVEVYGRCASACTVVLHNPHVCVAPSGSFMFHRAFIARDPEHGDFTRAAPSQEGTAAMWSMYPANVRAWINAHGGLTDHPLTMNAYQAWSIGIPRCNHG